MAEQLFQIGIKGLVRNKDGKILLLKTPAWGGSPEYWDLPGGRMDPGETFEQTLRRELREEISVDYTRTAKHIATVLSNLTIPVGDIRVPLVLMAYEVDLPEGVEIKLGEEDHSLAFDWFTPEQAAQELQVKYPAEFCKSVRQLA
ncbi:MAG TPA: NUDIX hydrolase [Candidatus Saccharimonadales bacterium]|nr:NUDIX hydrolase [Candidatus Saccharimonadales bacterium]